MDNWIKKKFLGKEYIECISCSATYLVEHLSEEEKDGYGQYPCTSLKCNEIKLDSDSVTVSNRLFLAHRRELHFIKYRCSGCNKVKTPDNYCHSCKMRDS